MDKNDYLLITAVIILAVVCILLLNYLGSVTADCSEYYGNIINGVVASCRGGVVGFPSDSFVFNVSWGY